MAISYKPLPAAETNAQIICLEPNDIRSIVAAVKAGNLPYTTGFFFGSSDTSPKRIAEDVAIFEKALAWLQTEESRVFRSVKYRASW
jgi:hypothetical protein